MYVYDLTLGILRICVYGTFFYKQANNTFRFYYIWPPAIVAWTLDGFCFYYSSLPTSTIDDDYQILTSVPYHTELLLLKAALTWFAIAMFYTRLDLYKEAEDDDDDPFISRTTRRRYYNTVKSPMVVDFFSLFIKCIIPTIIITAVIAATEYFTGASRQQHSTYDNPNRFKSISTVITNVITFAFLITNWWRFNKKPTASSSSLSPSFSWSSFSTSPLLSPSEISSAKSNPALLMYGCFITLNPIRTVFETFVILFRDHISIANIDTPMTFVSSISLIEIFLMMHVILIDEDRLADWPKFKAADTITQIQEKDLNRNNSNKAWMKEQ